MRRYLSKSEINILVVFISILLVGCHISSKSVMCSYFDGGVQKCDIEPVTIKNGEMRGLPSSWCSWQDLDGNNIPTGTVNYNTDAGYNSTNCICTNATNLTSDPNDLDNCGYLIQEPFSNPDLVIKAGKIVGTQSVDQVTPRLMNDSISWINYVMDAKSSPCLDQQLSGGAGNSYSDYVSNRSAYINVTIASYDPITYEYWVKLYDPQNIEIQAVKLYGNSIGYIRAWIKNYSERKAVVKIPLKLTNPMLNSTTTFTLKLEKKDKTAGTFSPCGSPYSLRVANNENYTKINPPDLRDKRTWNVNFYGTPYSTYSNIENISTSSGNDIKTVINNVYKQTDGHVNITFNSTQVNIASFDPTYSLFDANGNILLKESFFTSGTLNVSQLDNAYTDWCKRFTWYRKNLPVNSTSIIPDDNTTSLLLVNGYSVYNGTTLNTSLTNQINTYYISSKLLGNTLCGVMGTGYIAPISMIYNNYITANGTTWGLNSNQQKDCIFSSSCHELLHGWADCALDHTKTTDTDKHKGFCDGKDKSKCMFRYDSDNPANTNADIINLHNEFKFCEQHLQIIGNLLRSHPY